jgi:hypothetical protein
MNRPPATQYDENQGTIDAAWGIYDPWAAQACSEYDEQHVAELERLGRDEAIAYYHLHLQESE